MKILIAGDFCPNDRVATIFEKEDYSAVLSDVKSVVEKSDYSIVNFECPVVTGKATPIYKIGPNLKCSINGIKAIKWAGFDCVTLANNHFLDYGKEGVEQTITALDVNNIDHVGGGNNLEEASSILYRTVAGRTIAIINCCEHEFSIATESKAGSNPLNPIQQYNKIQEARKNADRVLVIVHGGYELFQLPSIRMVETYRFFIDSGADAVVNHHQHCLSGYEFYKGKPILYGLGNFLFDNPNYRDSIWNEGFMVSIDFSSNNPSILLYPYTQCSSEPLIKLLDKNVFDDRLREINDIISNQNLLKLYLNNYYNSQIGNYSQIFEPVRNRYYLYAKKRGWVPSLISNKRKLTAINYISCESHRDKLLYILSKI